MLHGSTVNSPAQFKKLSAENCLPRFRYDYPNVPLASFLTWLNNNCYFFGEPVFRQPVIYLAIYGVLASEPSYPNLLRHLKFIGLSEID